MVIGRCKIARGRPSGASSRDGGASSRRAAAGFPAISNNLLLERVEQHTVGVSGPPVRSTASAGAALALGATVSRYGGASSRRAAAGFPAISNDLSAERVDQHTVGVCGARVRSTASAGAALAPAPRRRARSETVAARAAGTELVRAAGQRRPCEPLGHGVTAGGPPGGAHIARLGLSEPLPQTPTLSAFQLHPRPARNRCRVRLTCSLLCPAVLGGASGTRPSGSTRPSRPRSRSRRRGPSGSRRGSRPWRAS